MKKIFTLITSLTLALVVLAAERPKSTLTIKSADQSDIRVVIDGRRFEPYSSYMRIRDMQPGYHSIKVYRVRQYIRAITGIRIRDADIIAGKCLYVPSIGAWSGVACRYTTLIL